MHFTTFCFRRKNLLLSLLLMLGLAVSVACGDSGSGETDGEDSHGESDGDDGHDSYPEVDCDAVEVKGYSEMTIWDSCTGCHSSGLMGADRSDAPVGVDFDTFEAAMAEIEHAASDVAAGAMPPGGGLSDAEKNELYVWARCGTPE